MDTTPASIASVSGSAGLEGLNLAAPSDHGRAFHALSRAPFRPGGRKTVPVVSVDADVAVETADPGGPGRGVSELVRRL